MSRSLVNVRAMPPVADEMECQRQSYKTSDGSDLPMMPQRTVLGKGILEMLRRGND